jgi:tripartite-type tricarboxylate transporter receptor subunit TctC
MGEVGFPAFTTSIWLGVLGPAKMPRDIVDRINGEVNRYLATPAAKEAPPTHRDAGPAPPGSPATAQ